MYTDTEITIFSICSLTPPSSANARTLKFYHFLATLDYSVLTRGVARIYGKGMLTHQSLPLQATNFHFMAEYGNPQLSKDEAGYYLTTLEAAVVFIETLSPDQLMLPTR